MSTSLGAEGEDGEGEVEASEDDERASEDNAQKASLSSTLGNIWILGRRRRAPGHRDKCGGHCDGQGAQVGSRVKFGEEWTMDDRRGVVEGSVSMCGSYFKGTFTDLRTKKVSELVGVRPEYTNNSSHARKRALNGIVLKTCVLGMMACGRLSCQLMLGVQPSPKANSAAGQSALALVPAGASGPEADGEAAGAAGAGAAPQSSDETSESQEDPAPRWLESDLLSGGLVVDAQLKADIASRIHRYSRSLGDASAGSEEGDEDGESHDEDVEKEDSGYSPGGTEAKLLSSEEAEDLSLAASKASMKWWLAAAFPMAKASSGTLLQEDPSAKAVLPSGQRIMIKMPASGAS